MNKALQQKLILLMTNAIAMILELVAARILSPHIGSSNTVWTLVIAMMLFANAVGNMIGGRLSDKFNVDGIIIGSLIFSALFVLLIYRVNVGFSQQILSLDNVFMIFFMLCLIMVPCITLGMIDPVINKVSLNQENTGKRSGKVFTTITIGSLLGTFIGGLYLIPEYGSNITLLLCSFMMAVLVIAYLSLLHITYQQVFIVFSACICLYSGFMIKNTYARMEKANHQGTMEIYETSDNYVRIYDSKYNGEDIVMFELSGGYSSAIFKDKAKKDELVFEYAKKCDEILEQTGEYDQFNRLFMIGGAGYTFPRYFLSHYSDKTIDVIELDSDVELLARKHFGFQEYVDKYSDRLKLLQGDGRVYLDKTEDDYDVILNDAFLGHEPAKTLVTVEAVKAIKKNLRKDGIYEANLIGSFDDTFIQSEAKTVATQFKYVWLIPTNSDLSEYQNFVLVASDKNYNLKGVNLVFTDDMKIYTDDVVPR